MLLSYKERNFFKNNALYSSLILLMFFLQITYILGSPSALFHPLQKGIQDGVVLMGNPA